MKRARILVVDDDADIRGLLRELLERASYDVVEASNGRDGLRTLYGSSPDLVLLDVSMPELDGWQTLERIRDVSVGGHPVALTPLEFKLLAAFVRHPNQVLSHEQLLELVWGDALTGSRARTKLYVGYLREKLAAAGVDDSPIETV